MADKLLTVNGVDNAGRASAYQLAAESLAAGSPTGWFERYYAEGSRAGSIPWDPGKPWRMLTEWASARRLRGYGRRAVVVGCGLGLDAEYLAGLGFTTTAFDIAETAVRTARERRPDSSVDYRVANLLDPPDEWRRAFDLVVEIQTVQSLPDPHQRTAIGTVANLVAPGGILIVIAAERDEAAADPGPPWPLRRAEIDAFAALGDLQPVRIESMPDPDDPETPRWRAEFHRPHR